MSLRTTPQGVDSSTFNPAPFDHDLSIPELYQYHAEHSPDHPVFMYSDTEAGITHLITYREAWQRILKAVTLISRQLELKPGSSKVVAVLALSDTLSYMYLLIGIMSLGLTPFPMSPRNNAEATAHLLKQTGAPTIFTNTEGPSRALVTEAAGLLERDGVSLRILPMFKYEELNFSPSLLRPMPKMVPIAVPETVLILHSSGTTAFPKPINITKKGMINLSNIPCYGELDLEGKRIAAHTNPTFHAMGLGTFIWPPSSGAIFAVYNPKPIIPTPANFLAGWVADKCDIVFCVPVFIEAWAQDPDNIPRLAALDLIVFSGASVNKSIGDMLEVSGVTMHPFWGSTEIGPATMFIPRDPAPKGEWEYLYFKFSNHITLENVFEPIMIPTDICFPHIINTTYEDKPEFNVGDLLERHPTDANRWKVYGRTDDQIILSTGENFNPLPIEGIISQDDNIRAAIMFGRHHLHTGILVQPVIDVDTAQQLHNFKDQIWSTIEKANLSAPAYARIQKNMIIATSPRKPLEFTPKGTPRRQVALRLYAAEIEALYGPQGPLADRQFPDRA